MSDNSTLPEEQKPEEKKDKAIYSTEKTLRFISYSAEAYGGITEDTAVVVTFPRDKNLLGFSGDQGKNKTSAMNAAIELFGGPEAENAINSMSNKKSATLVFEETKNNLRYMVKIQKSKFSLEQITETEDGKLRTAELKKPKELLRSLIGPLGINLMELKEMKPAQQIKWVRDLSKLSDEQVLQEQRIKTGIKTSGDGRKDVNRDMIRIRTGLVAAGYGVWKASARSLTPTKQYEDQKKFYTKDVKERQALVTQKFDEANKKKSDLQVEKMINENLIVEAINIDDNIIDLERKLVELRERKEKNVEFKRISDDKITALGDVEALYTAAQESMSKMTEYIEGRKNIESVDKAYAEYDTLDEQWKQHQSKLDEYMLLHKKAVAAFTPDIEGIEVCVPFEVDINFERDLFMDNNPEATEQELSDHIKSLTGEKREGLYYKGHSMAELSESEVWEVAMKFWHIMGVKVAFIENIQSLGTSAIEAINYMAEQGCTIFFSAMKRTEGFKAEFYQQIPE